MKNISYKKIKNKHPEVLYGRTGILLVNLGTPESTKWLSIRKYLKEFLSDKRIIEVNRILWFLILNIIILTFRPSKTSKAYKEIWLTKFNKSPLRYYTEKLSYKVSKKLNNRKTVVDYAMRYGNPSIPEKIDSLQKLGCDKIIALPLYPQYASATTASVCDKIFETFMNLRWQPSLQIIPQYTDNILYINALVKSIKKKLNEIKWKPEIIIASYHGIPKRYFLSGDPYHCYCQKTTRLIKEKLKSNVPIVTTFQSRFGPEEWLKPYTDITLKELPAKNVKNVMLICPGFACDCIETLEEIKIRAKEDFFISGGLNFSYVPCLNDTDDHVTLVENLIKSA